MTDTEGTPSGPDAAPRKRFSVTRTNCVALEPAVTGPRLTSPPPPQTMTVVDGDELGGGWRGTRSPLVHSCASGSPSNDSASQSRSLTTPPLAHSLPPRTAPVPLITPRYQKKTRTRRQMEVTDSFPAHMTPTEALRQHTTETMTIQNGAMAYDQVMHFHTYDLFRHGRHHIHSRSIGYSSEGDLVMTREDYSEPSDVDNGFTRKQVVISEPTVLVPHARRPLTEQEQHSRHKIRLNRPRYKKYPGIHIPRNRKLRNRLLNDHFVHEYAKQILHLSRERHEAGVCDDDPPVRPFFTALPRSLRDVFDVSCDAASPPSLRRRNDVQPVRDPDSGEARLHSLNMRLRAELQHALQSEFLSHQIEDLDVLFTAFVARGATPEFLVFRFRDGYGRLLCHGVAAYYQLSSESKLLSDGVTKHTYVGLPRQRRSGRLRELRVPYVPLLHTLRRHRGSEPARHSLSTNSTPALAPQPAHTVPPDGASPPMSPLDLNAGCDEARPCMEDTSGGARRDGSSASSNCTHSDEEDDEAVTVDVVNTTVCVTVKGVLTTPEVPVYVPQLRLGRRRRRGETAATRDGEAATASPSLTATQRRKQKKALRAAAREAVAPENE